jgi:hypothetical protein
MDQNEWFSSATFQPQMHIIATADLLTNLIDSVFPDIARIQESRPFIWSLGTTHRKVTVYLLQDLR